MFDSVPKGFESLEEHGANVQLIFIRSIDGKIVPDNEAHIFKNRVPKNIKQVFDKKVYPVGKMGLTIPENVIGFIILGRQLIFDNSNSVIEYYTGVSREVFLGFKSAITVYDIIPPKYFKVGVYLNGTVNEKENNMNKYLFNSIHISKNNKIVSITLNESLTKVQTFSEDYENNMMRAQLEKRMDAITKVKEDLEKNYNLL
tara:strand:- start:676 stop:1278 length:603 start_codon:yes stop_codon:yes gene_type:complete